MSRNHRELENIIQLLGRFDRAEEAIMAREVISDSLYAVNIPDPKGPLVLDDLLRGSRQRVNTEAHDLSMSSWTMRSQQDCLRQESESELVSEIFSDSFLLIQKDGPKIAVGFSN